MKADKAAVTRLLKTARGQIDGIIKMVESDKYCIDVVTQIMASVAVLRKAMKTVLQAHIAGCVNDSFEGNKKDKAQKIEELMNVFDKLSK